MLKLEDVSVIYNEKTIAVNKANLEIKQGEFVGIIGHSGSGKSSLLKAINLLVKPSNGKVYIDNVDITNLNSQDLRNIRKQIGFIFQDYNLVDRSSVLENVLLGRLGYKSSLQSILGIFTDDEYEQAYSALGEVGLLDKVFVRADELSGGQKQRVAIAKTLCQNPRIILADEPVSSLDVTTAKSIMEYFKGINQKNGITIMVNLHDVELAKIYCNRIIALKNGNIIFDKEAGDFSDELLEEIYSKD